MGQGRNKVIDDQKVYNEYGIANYCDGRHKNIHTESSGI